MFGKGLIDTERLSATMIERGVSQAGLAKAVGVSPAAIQQILNGSTKRSRYLGDIARHLEVSPEWLLGISDHKEGDLIKQTFDHVEPVLMFGLGQILEDSNHFGTMRYLDKRLFPFEIGAAHGGSSFTLINQLGTDMSPTIWHHDVLLIDEDIIEPDEQDKVWIVAVGGIPLVRRWRGLSGALVELIADNPQVPSMRLEAPEVRIIGRVMWHGKLSA